MITLRSIAARIARIVLTFALTVALYPAAAFAGYSFADADYLTASQNFPRWAALMARHAAQTAELDACLADGAQCAGALRAFRTVVVDGASLDARRKIDLANRFINTRRWSIEPRRDDDWRTLDEFLHNGGDCEDFAIAKYFLLRRLGFAVDDVRVAITWDHRVHAYHAVTLVHWNGSVYVLDVDGPPRFGQANYRFLFSINESGVWDRALRRSGHRNNDVHRPQGEEHS